MRTPISLVACLTIGVVAACSNPPSEAAVETDPSFASELELAIFAATGAEEAGASVVSDLEIRQPGPPAPESKPAVDLPVPLATVSEPAVSLATLDEPSYGAPALPKAEVIGPVAVNGGADHDGRASGSARPRTGGIGVIIRGAVGERDPCAIHLPGGARDALGAIGVLVNNPTPRGIGVQRSGGGGRAMSPRSGGMFAGGIR